MPLNEEPKNSESNIFADSEKNIFAEEAKKNIFAPSTEALRGMMTRPGIGMATAEELKKPNIVLRLLGISQGIDSTLKSDTYNMLDAKADELETQGFMGMWAGSKLRETQGQIMAANVAFSMLDWEERPRKILSNLMYVEGKKNMETARLRHEMPGVAPRAFGRAVEQRVPGAGWDDYRQAISDGIDGIQHKGFLYSYQAAVNPYAAVAKERFLERHPTLKKIDSITMGVSEFATAIALEIAIAKVGTKAKKPISAIFGRFIKTPKQTDSIDDMFQEVADAVAKDAGAQSPVDGLMKAMQENPDTMDEIFRSYQTFLGVDIPGAQSLDDVVKGLGYRKWINANILHKNNPLGVIEQKDVRNIIEAMNVYHPITRTIPPKPFAVTDIVMPKMAESLKADFVEAVGGLPSVLQKRVNIKSISEGRLTGLYEGTGGRYLAEGRRVFLETGWRTIDPDTLLHETVHSLVADMGPGDLAFVKDFIRARYPDVNIKKFIAKAEASSNPAAFDMFSQEDISNAISRYADSAAYRDTRIGKVIEKHFTEKSKVIETFGQQKKMYTELNFNELEDLALEMQMIKDMPVKFKNGAIEQIRRKSYGPPVGTFTRLGLERRYMNTMSGIYLKQEWYNRGTTWLIDTKREFKRQFKKTIEMGDNVYNHAMSYAAEGIGYDDIPDELRKTVTETEFTWLRGKALEDQDVLWNPFADIAEEQGKVTTDPMKIAAGIAPRQKNYYKNVYDDIAGYMQKRMKDAAESGSKVEVPIDYDLDKVIKEGRIPKGREASSWIARESTREDYSRDWIRIRQIALREQAHDLFVREQMLLNKAVIEALPDDAMKGTAKAAMSGWHNQILSQSSGWDKTLNKAFNSASRRMEKILPKWEARERAFNHFSQFMSRRIDQGLLLANPRPTVRNLFQTLLTTNIYGHGATLWGYQQLLTPGGRKLLKTSQVYLQRGIPLAAFDVTKKASWRQLTYLGIHATDKYLNVATSYLAGWRYYFGRNRRAWDELVGFAAERGVKESALRGGSTFSSTVADAVNAGMFKDARMTIDFKGIGMTQWHYDAASMPPLLTSSGKRLALKYTNWTDYMWGAHMPQAVNQLRTGKDIFGMKASPAVRGALFGMMAKGALLYGLGNEIGVNMAHLAIHTSATPTGYLMGKQVPFPMSPAIGSLVGIGNIAYGALKLDDNMIDSGIDQLVYSGKSFIPVYGVYRQVQKVKEGEQDILGLFLPTPRKKKDTSKSFLPGIKGIDKTSFPEFPKY